ncbi:MAG: amidohydrolase family protein [Gimesia sp.]|nr:amidohydrolase family protein [Gimesia sp.]
MNEASREINRRELLGIAATAGIATTLGIQSACSAENESPGFSFIDTNISLFSWPFRRLPLDNTQKLVHKLRSLGIAQAWAGSFEGILQRNIAAVNLRLADECKGFPELVPIGSINPTLPNWENDLQRCSEIHNMPAIRLHPNYHGYTLEDPRLVQLLKQATLKGCFVQIASALEDVRTQHSKLQVPDVDLTTLPALMKSVPGARVQILNARPRPDLLKKLANTPGIFFDTARIEATDGVPTLMQHLPPERVMLGTHAPFLIPEAALLRVHESSKLDTTSLQSLLSKNAEKLLADSQPSRPAIRKNQVGNRASQKTTSAAKTEPGLPSSEKLEKYRIWDSYFTPSHSHPGRDGNSKLIAEIERALPAIRKAKFEKLCYFAHVGIGTTNDPALEKSLRSQPEVIQQPLKRWPNLLLGMIQLNANNVPASLDALNRWLQDGPMRGVYFPGGGPAAVTCTHRNFNPLIERIAELNGVIMQHTWFKTGGKRGPGESTPSELAVLAKRFPNQKFLCAHAGGEWEQGIRAVQDSENILVETSGFDATAGFIEMAVRELGADRIVFGSHLPSRSLGTELCKVTAAEISEADKCSILGENFRKLLSPDSEKS